jgi:hypothetical protein
MPFGMGPAGWFLMPQIAAYWPQWYPRAAPSYWYPQPWGTPSAAQELQFLKDQAQFLEDQLQQIRTRIANLEKVEQ